MTSILHVGDASGISHVLAKYQNRMPGYRAEVLLRERGDGHGMATYYNERGWRRVPIRGSPIWKRARSRRYAIAARFADIVNREAKKYDIVHIHVSAELVPLVRSRHPRKKIVLHHHGDRLRMEARASLEPYERHADKVLVSTPDLREYGGHEWLPNPVDTDLFSGRSVSRNGRGLYLLLGGEPEDVKIRVIKESGIGIGYVVRDTKYTPVKHADMPSLLSAYEYYIDVKWLPIGRVMRAVSATGLQALSVGCKVVDHEFAVREGLPGEHRPEEVVSRLGGHYEEIGGGTGRRRQGRALTGRRS